MLPPADHHKLPNLSSRNNERNQGITNQMDRPCYKFRVAVIATALELHLLYLASWGRDVSEKRATQGGVRQSKRGRGVLGRCEIHEGFCGRLEFYRER